MPLKLNATLKEKIAYKKKALHIFFDHYRAERNVLQLTEQRCSGVEIAKKLRVKPGTVYKRLKMVRRVFDVDTTEKAIKEGLYWQIIKKKWKPSKKPSKALIKWWKNYKKRQKSLTPAR